MDTTYLTGAVPGASLLLKSNQFMTFIFGTTIEVASESAAIMNSSCKTFYGQFQLAKLLLAP